MKEIKLGLLLFLIVIICWILELVSKDTSKTNSPVEETYHRELVNTIDSILDARCIDNTTFSCDSVCGCME